ncbi:hypothetical protein [Rossellomorea aquimaris]|uniref:hypothetical protein n=1 Tax=Rossellomorea aquimaris TaxID=189382 RepID=UPI0007D0AF2A|nr:hypothetical protein [Rossellomorea aquimaris]
MLNVLSTKFIAGALSLAIIAPTAYAAAQEDQTTTQPNSTIQEQAPLDEETKAKLEEIKQQVEDGTITKEEAHEKMEALGVHPPFGKRGKHGFQDLDEETKQALEDIRAQVESGEITEEEAQSRLAELGVKKPPHHGHDRPELDEETRQKLDDIRKQVEAGEITKEEAQEKLAELGIEKPFRKGRFSV